MNKCIPSTTIPLNKNNRPWLSKHIAGLIKQKNNLYSRAKHCPCLLPRFKSLRNRVTSELRAAKQAFFKNLNPSNKSFWKLIKQLKGDQGTIPTLKYNDNTADSDELKASVLSEQFSKSFNTRAPPLCQADVMTPKC